MCSVSRFSLWISNLKNNGGQNRVFRLPATLRRAAMQTKARKHCVCYVNARAGFFFFLRLDDAPDVLSLIHI